MTDETQTKDSDLVSLVIELPRVTLVGTSNLKDPSKFYLETLKSYDADALSLQLDVSEQRELNDFVLENSPADRARFPNFYSCMDYARDNEIPLFASAPGYDNYLAEYRSLREEIANQMRNKTKIKPNFEDWKDNIHRLNGNLSVSTYEQIKDLLTSPYGRIVHLGTIDQVVNINWLFRNISS